MTRPTFGTTVYSPAHPDGHRYQRPADEPTNWAKCAVCGGDSWATVHELAESHADVTVTGPGWFAVEASDDNGRTFAANGLRWRDLEDARRWAGGLAMRWFGCTDIRVRACDRRGEPVGDAVHTALDHA